MRFNVQVEQESDGRWIAEVADFAGAMAYGQSAQQAIAKAEALALRIMADRLEHGETVPPLNDVFAVVA